MLTFSVWPNSLRDFTGQTHGQTQRYVSKDWFSFYIYIFLVKTGLCYYNFLNLPVRKHFHSVNYFFIYLFPVENGIKLQGWMPRMWNLFWETNSSYCETYGNHFFIMIMSLFYFIFLSENFFIEFFTAIIAMTLMVYSKFEIWDLVEKWILYFGRACYQFSDYY